MAINLRAGFVTGLHWPNAYQMAVKDAVKKGGHELCFRISGYELRQGSFGQALENLLDFFGRDPDDVHLVIDFQSITDTLPNVGLFANSIPHLDEWKSFALISGAFPKDLTDIKKNSQHEQPRNDWLVWKEFAASTNGRVPSFGDYTMKKRSGIGLGIVLHTGTRADGITIPKHIVDPSDVRPKLVFQK